VDDLAQLIDGALDPPALAALGRWRSALRRALLRAGRPHALHQQQIDRALTRALVELRREQRESAARTLEELQVLREELGGLRGWLEVSSARTGEVAGRLEAFIADVERDRQGMTSELSRLAQRVPDAVALHGTELERFDAGLGGEVVGFRGGEGEASDQLYVGFEDLFRGSEELIRDRQRAYLPLLRGRGPVLDVGCGRGEMLELLREHDVEADGIDIDQGMVEHCRAKGLERVQVADGVRHLESLGEGAVGAVFAAQVIEHLPYPDLLRFLQATRRALAPGGILIVETVNPHAPQALKHFWLDPTHQHPLFPEAVIALCRLTGFAGAFVWHPQGSGDPERDRLEQHDYAVVAEAPSVIR
jgi:SAM-dependent methyltransferase